MLIVSFDQRAGENSRVEMANTLQEVRRVTETAAKVKPYILKKCSSLAAARTEAETTLVLPTSTAWQSPIQSDSKELH